MQNDDFLLTPIARDVWRDRYALKDELGNPIEKSIFENFRRVARAIASKEDDPQRWEDEFYEVMSNRLFCPAGRILANAGTHFSQLLNCYVIPFEDDSLEAIMDTARKMAVTQKLGGGCIGGESLVITDKGPVPIKNIVDSEDNFKVLSYNSEERKMEYCDVLDKHTTSLPGNRVFEVCFKARRGIVSARIRASDWHPFFVFDGEEVVEVRADELKPGMAVIGSNDLVNQLDPWGWVLGYVAGDGAIDRNNRKDIYAHLRITDDSEECIKRASEVLGVTYKESEDNRYKVPMWTCEAYGEIAGRIRDEFGGYRNSHTKNVPESIWTSSSATRFSFLVGYLDSDGYYNKNKKRFEIFTVSERLKKEVIALAGSIGVRCSVRFRKKRRESESDGWEIRLLSSQTINDTVKSISAKYPPLDAGWVTGTVDFSLRWKERLGLELKKQDTRGSTLVGDRLVSLFSWLHYGKVPRETAYVLLSSCGENKLAGSVFSSQIVDSVRCTEVEETLYDLTVDKNQTYVASDPNTGAYIVVHNTGHNYSTLRPAGSHIKGVNGRSCGVLGFIDMMSVISGIIEQGGSRRGANLGLLEVWHPDIWEYISFKNDHEWDHLLSFMSINDSEKWQQFKHENAYKLQMYNISIGVSDEFLAALEKNRTWPLRWGEKEWELYKVQYHSPSETKEFEVTADSWETAFWKVRKKIPFLRPDDSFKVIDRRRLQASEIWDKLCYNAWANGCPGIINLSECRKMHNGEYYDTLTSTNPCVTGDTQVALADGRGSLSMGEIAKEDRDVPVFCQDGRGRLAVRMMRNPRITGYNQKILKITISNGHSVRVTESHKFLLTTGEYRQAKNLQPGDSLSVMNRLVAPFDKVIRDKHSTSQKYCWVKNSNMGSYKPEHRLIHGFYNPYDDPANVVHHKDGNSLNNAPENLGSMSKEDHDGLHVGRMFGDGNPMRRAAQEWSEEKWDQYRSHMSESVSGVNNGRSMGISNEELFSAAVKRTLEFGRKLSTTEWKQYAREQGLVSQFSEYRSKYFGGLTGFLEKAAKRAGIELNLSGVALREYNRYLKIREESDLKVLFEDGIVKVERFCEGCGNKYKIPYLRREQSFCSRSCALRERMSDDGVRKHLSDSMRERGEEKKKLQMKTFNDFCAEHGRDPLKKEFTIFCKEKGIPFRLSSRGERDRGAIKNTFSGWREFKEAARTYNHRVVSVEPDGCETVYNGTVDEFHNFYIGHFEEEVDGYKSIFYLNNLQCGEQPLVNHGSCNLSSIVLPSFYNPNINDVDYPLLEKTVHTAVRFLDDVTDCCDFPMKEAKEVSQRERRIGLGTVGVHDLLISLKLGYDTDEGREKVAEVLSFIRDKAYEASIELSKEKGSFPVFDAEKYLESGFTKTLSKDIRGSIHKHGIRNVCLLSQAPTGTTGTMLSTSTGCEPWFALSFSRRTGIGSYEDGCREYLKWRSEHPEERRPDYFKTAMEIKPEDHLKMMMIFTRHVDSAVSKTINLPKETTVQEVGDVFLKALKQGVKGMTVFRDGCRMGVLESKDTQDRHKEDREEVRQPGIPEEPPASAQSLGWRKRGNRTVGATSRIYLNNHNMYITVNKNESGDLVEVFATVGESKDATTYQTSGIEDSWAEGLGKIISLALRAGVDPEAIIRNLKNIPSDKPVFATIGKCESSELLPSPPHAIARVMEEEMKFLYRDEIQDESPKKGHCKVCSSTNLNRRSSTCYECLDCGYSGCG